MHLHNKPEGTGELLCPGDRMQTWMYQTCSPLFKQIQTISSAIVNRKRADAETGININYEIEKLVDIQSHTLMNWIPDSITIPM